MKKVWWFLTGPVSKKEREAIAGVFGVAWFVFAGAVILHGIDQEWWMWFLAFVQPLAIGGILLLLLALVFVFFPIGVVITTVEEMDMDRIFLYGPMAVLASIIYCVI